MKAFAACLVAVLCVGQATAITLPNGCPLPDPLDYTVHQPHETDCTKFYKCDNGVKVPFDCPAGLYFNPTLWVCDWPDHAGCTSGSSSTAETPVPTKSTTSSPAVTPVPTESTTSSPSITLPNGCPLPDPLNYTVHLPHETDCTKFYKCDNGVKVPFDCPAGLYFNPTLWVCDWPDHAGCTSGSSSTAETPVPTEATTFSPAVTCPGFPTGNEQLPVPYNCTLYQTCVAGNIIINECPTHQVFDIYLGKCDWDCHAKCHQEGCPGFPDGVEVVPNPDDCHTWLTCEDDAIVVNPCPEEKNFDVNSLTCEWDCHAVCAQRVTTPLPTEGTVAPAVRAARRRLL